VNGLLHRLAGQALGNNGSVRPASPSRLRAAVPVASDETGTPAREKTGIHDAPHRGDVERVFDVRAAPLITESVPSRASIAEMAGAPNRAGETPNADPAQAAIIREPERLLPLQESAENWHAVDRARPQAFIDDRHSPPAAAIPPAALVAPADRSKPDRAGEVNEVHVHIGRIEVTALSPEKPARQRAAARQGSATSLEDYLAQRQRRTP
jgi:hypothetical protein